MEKSASGATSRIACDVPIETANAFRAKVAAEGLNIKEVMTNLIEDYVRKGKKS